MTDTTPSASTGGGGRISDPERKEILAQAVAVQVIHGDRVESQSGFQAVLVSGKPVNHVFHLVMTLVTCGIWGIIWLGLIGLAGETRFILRVDQFGNIVR